VINIMQLAGVTFAHGNTVRSNPPVDFERLIRLDTLITRPPQNIDSTLEIIEWADTTLGMIKRALQFKP
jgi:hypothetical protein